MHASGGPLPDPRPLPIPGSLWPCQDADPPAPLQPGEPDLLADDPQDAEPDGLDEAPREGNPCPCGCGGAGEDENHMLVPDPTNGFHDLGGIRIYAYFGRCMHSYERCEHAEGCPGDPDRTCCDLLIYVSFTPDWRVRRVSVAGHLRGRLFSFPPERAGEDHGHDNPPEADEPEESDEDEDSLDGAYEYSLGGTGEWLSPPRTFGQFDMRPSFGAGGLTSATAEILTARSTLLFPFADTRPAAGQGAVDSTTLRPSATAPQRPAPLAGAGEFRSVRP